VVQVGAGKAHARGRPALARRVSFHLHCTGRAGIAVAITFTIIIIVIVIIITIIIILPPPSSSSSFSAGGPSSRRAQKYAWKAGQKCFSRYGTLRSSPSSRRASSRA
jgi:hypothetical protein